MKTMEGLATSSTAMVSRFLCSTDKPLWPGRPTTAPACDSNSTRPSTCRAATHTQRALNSGPAASDNMYYGGLKLTRQDSEQDDNDDVE
ncbi:MAG: hypothetical protein FRX49_10262 [Trebouxia sp. A1-2]|nr:MAG: hypothetical protein FRX49_10262 [Trebouxia sp. A1-2]